LASRKLKFNKIVFEVTNNCNHHCNHCYNYWRNNGGTPVFKNELSKDQILYLISKVQKDTELNTVAFSGGEPFLRNDVAELIRDSSSMGLNVVLITNGSLINQNNINNIPKTTFFEITLFSFNEKIHNQLAGTNCFQRVINAIYLLSRSKFRIAVAIVITKINFQDIEKTIKLAVAIGADSIMLNRINLGHHSMQFAHQLVPSCKELKFALSSANKCSRDYGIGISVSVPIPPCLINPNDFPNLVFGWCPRGNDESYYTVGNTGFVRPCNHSSQIIGNLFEQSFKEIVTSKLAKEYWKTVPAQCANCNQDLQNKCKGGCIAASFECKGTGKLLDPFIEHSLSSF